MSKKIKIAFAGLGGRGNCYAEHLANMSDKVELVAAADIDAEKLQIFSDKYGIPENMRFGSAEEMLERERLADVMVIATMDRQHYGHAIPALNKGYHLLLEKPISPSYSECLEIADTANKLGLKVLVCHVLRYTPFYNKIKEIIDSGVIGKVKAIQGIEQVGFWHQAHSFVRGNWRDSNETTPMIMQKCCHDTDILLWLTGKKCLSVSSFGNLSHFKKENAPAGAPERCSEKCPIFKTCPYSIEYCYLSKAREENFWLWPINIVTPIPTYEELTKRLETGPYGRCVYHCDNNVVDHQVVNMWMEDDIAISYTMCAFTDKCAREIHVMGTFGEIVGDAEAETVKLTVFGKETEVIDTTPELGDELGHGGGDWMLVKDLVALFADGEGECRTDINQSVESHIVALAAEESRINGGAVVDVQAKMNK